MYCSIVLLAVALSVGGASLAGPARGVATGCKAGVRKVPGGGAHILCEARATVTVRGKKYVLKNGECDLYPKYVSVRIGSVAKHGSYFALFVGRSPVAPQSEPVAAHDGTYRRGVIVLATPKVLGLLFDETDFEVVLGHHRRSGTFSGTNPANPRLKRPSLALRGTFSC